MIPLESKIAVGAVLFFFAALELAKGRFWFRDKTTRADVILDAVSTVAVPLVIIPTVLFASFSLVDKVAPGTRDMWAHWPLWAMFLAFLVFDDFTQYLWHRTSHTSWLYPLHRAHHSAPYLSVRIVYRNNLVYYALMPGVWLSGMLFYFGLGEVYIYYGVAKLSVIIGAHSSVPWDAKLREWAPTRPLIWVLERIISTPSTHAAHHGLHESDGVTHYRGNYGNFLFLWDVLLGTAKITGRRPAEYGIEDLAPATWFEELVWPYRLGSAPSPAPEPAVEEE